MMLLSFHRSQDLAGKTSGTYQTAKSRCRDDQTSGFVKDIYLIFEAAKT